MPNLAAAFDPAAFPLPADPERARLGAERWRESVATTEDGRLVSFTDAVLDDADARRIVDAVFGNSPFLTHCIEREPHFACRLIRQGPDMARDQIVTGLADTRRNAAGGADPSAPLRVAKRQLALTTALADIAGAWTLEQVTGTLTDFAEMALECASAYLLADLASRDAITLPDPADPQKGSGLVVIGMGKLGARELNFSSDVDIIVLYDSERIVSNDPDRLQHTFVRLTRNLVRIMEERTAEGYVFRTDLRLRPDPGATPPALSVAAAEAYYEALGQNWERAAMIKARPVAGDREAGSAFLDHLKPFIWRKNLDFAAIQDIHSIKRQIHAHRGGDRIAIAGHNIKLGRGGIREIEFFAQTQQLIWGGRHPELRGRATVRMLNALADGGFIGFDAAANLIETYGFLRRVEHRLQMIEDEQTHSLPKNADQLQALAQFLGYADGEAFGETLLGHLRAVEACYADLFEDAPSLSVGDEIAGNLVFTGSDPDPETLETLTQLGFRNAGAVDRAVRGWHHGRCRAMRSQRARELLTELMPILLKSLSNTGDPDTGFLAFDAFLNTLPAGIQLFSMLHSNPHLLELVAETMGGARGLSGHLSRHPSVLEGVLNADFFDPPPSAEFLNFELETLLDRCPDIEEVLDVSRRWAHDRTFQVGVQSLRGHIDAPATAMALSNIADAALVRLLPCVESEFAAAHGVIPGSGMAIIAMGKLGGREMTATSDLDLIFVYGTPEEGAVSNGDRPLSAPQYFARLSQRLINAVTAPTSEGRLYEVDMRLRPSGKAGPIAVSFASFERYQSTEAWTWEQMALTRARVIAGPASLAADIETTIREVLTRERDLDELLADVADMRGRMDDEHHTDSIWEVKHLRGGIVDIEFIAQYLQLRHAHVHPEVVSPNTAAALTAIRDAACLDTSVADDLIMALALWQEIQARLRLGLSGRFDAEGAEDAPRALVQALAGVGGTKDIAALDALVRQRAERIHAHFVRLIQEPASRVESAGGLREIATNGQTA